jgi:hypothetical protein
VRKAEAIFEQDPPLLPVSWEKTNDGWFTYVKGHNPYHYFGMYDVVRFDMFWLDKQASLAQRESNSGLCRRQGITQKVQRPSDFVVVGLHPTPYSCHGEGVPLKHKATCHGGGGLPRHAHAVRVRLGGVTIWRIQCTTCTAVLTILPHCLLRYHQMRPEVAHDALLATHGGLRLELCADFYHISLMAQPFSYGHLCARSLAVEMCFPL